MVSIPSSQIKNIIYFDINAKKQSIKNAKPHTNVRLAIKKAENEGYFTHLTSEYLIKKFSKDNKMEETNYGSVDMLKSIKVIILHQQNIQKISSLEYCRNIVYLNLSKNFISDISVLKHCQNLICLDLSSNLIEGLPDFNFWNSLVTLKFVYLHDNPIANPDSIMGMCSCPSITLLTLWDSPLALRRKYRHFVVNSIWSLKVLDNHFVSDEEIIEDANFKNSFFKSMSEKLLIDSYQTYNNHDDDAIEIDLKRFLVKINSFISHLSPVLIIQRWIRGYLVRKRYRKTKSRTPKLKIDLPKIAKSPIAAVSENTQNQENVKYLKIDLFHLNKNSTIENMDKEASIRSLITSTLNMLTYRSFIKQDQDKCSPEHISRALKSHMNFAEDPGNDYNLDEKISFKFRGSKPPISTKHIVTEVKNEKSRSHYFIREADRHYHDQLLTQLPEIKSKPLKKVNSSILFRKAQDCMSLFLLNKWDKADRDIQDIQRFHDKMATVQMVKVDREVNQIKLEEAKLNRLASIRQQHNELKAVVEKSMETEKKNQKMASEMVKMKKIESADRRIKMMQEMGFSQDFRSKQTAASKAVDKFEQTTYKQEQLESSKVAVDETRKKMKIEKETVKAYLENQAINRRTERTLENSALDLQILQQTNNQMNDAKMRVEKLKAIHRLVSCPQLPVIQLSAETVKN